LAILLRTEIKTAEDIKRQYGNLFSLLKKTAVRSGKKIVKKEDLIELSEKNISFSKKLLDQIIASRVSEIFVEVEKCLKKITGQEKLPAGLVLAGGGSSLPGIVDFAKEKFSLPCHLSQIKGIKSPGQREFSACYGVCLLGLEKGNFVSGARNNQKGFLEKVKHFLRLVFKAFLP